MKFANIIDVYYEVFTVEYEVHSIYSSVTGRGKILQLQYYLWAISAKSSFHLSHDFLSYQNVYILHGVLKLCRSYTGLHKIFLKRNFLWTSIVQGFFFLN